MHIKTRKEKHIQLYTRNTRTHINSHIEKYIQIEHIAKQKKHIHPSKHTYTKTNKHKYKNNHRQAQTHRHAYRQNHPHAHKTPTQAYIEE